MIGKHTFRAFDEALDDLFDRISTMGNEVLSMVETAGRLFRQNDIVTAKRLIEEDLNIDRQHDEANAAVVEILARLHPVARDLRDVLAAEHIAADLERIADHAKGIAKRSIAQNSSGPLSTSDLLDSLHQLVVRSLRDALRAFAERNPGLADEVLRRDEQIDRMRDDLFHTVIASLRSPQADVLSDVHTLFIGKGLERIGDHATNMAEEVQFMTRGDLPSATRESEAASRDG